MMKNILLPFTVFFFTNCSINAQYIPVPEKSSISLNGIWKFNPSPGSKTFESSDFNSNWKDINVPGEWTMQGFTVEKGVRAAYQTSFSIPGEWKDRRIILRFDGVYSDAIVWINGRKSFSHIGGFNAFESDVTGLIRKGQNLLTVGVMNESIADTLSCGSQYAAHPLGGIPRKVTLFCVPLFHISDMFVRTDFDRDYHNATIRLNLEFTENTKTPAGGTLNIDLLSPDGSMVKSGSRVIQPGGGSKQIDIEIDNPQKWNAEYPVLYTLRLRLSSENGDETIEKKIGFRKLEIAGNQLFVNGVPVKLHGVNRHEVHPLSGRSLNMFLWREDARLYKEANVNYIRTSHYPPPEEFIGLCDSAGFYVELENPLVWIGHNANLSLDFNEAWDTSLRKELVKTTRETITFYRNHPAIIIWSLANESAWTKNWEAALDEADRLDPSRPKSFHDQAYGLYNNFGSTALPIANIHYPGPDGPAIADTFSRPLLFGEYCHLNTYNRQEIATDPGVRDAWVKGFHAMWEKMYRSRGCLGGALWSGIDDAFMPPGGKLVGYGEWGPVDGWRRRKPEYFHVMKTYSPVIISTRKTTVNADGEILIQVENRFDFTDLNDCRFEWELGREKGNVSLKLAPHNSGILRIGPFREDISGEALRLKSYSPYGRLIDESEIDIGTLPSESLPFRSMNPGTLSRTETNKYFRISEGNIKWYFDKVNGKLAVAMVGPDTVISGGAELMVLPLHSEECKTEHSLNIPFMNTSCSDWKLLSVNSSEKGDTVCIMVGGTYREAVINISYNFLKGGTLFVKYNFTASMDINPRQTGLVFSLPGSVHNLNWHRKGFWTSYPDWHIGRIDGNTVPFPPNVFYLNQTGVRPEGEWMFDANALGCNDFRSTKSGIYWAGLTNTRAVGVIILSDGRQAFRSWVNGNGINFLVADYSNGGAEIFFASHLESERRPLKTGDNFAGSVTLKLLGGN